MKFISKTLLFFCFLLSCAGDRNKFPKLENGILNLQNHSFKEVEHFSLEGEWKFTPGEFTLHETEKTILVSIPESPNWNSYNPNSEKEKIGYGIGSYHLTIYPPHNTEKFAIDFTILFSDCEVYQNKIKIGSTGSLTNTMEGFDIKPHLMPLLPANNNPIHLTVFVKNRFYPLGGIRIPPSFGTYESLKTSREKEILKDAIVVGGFIFLGFYQLGMHFTRRKIIGSLYFFLFCFVMSFQILAAGSETLFVLFESIPSEVVFRIDFFTQYIGVILGLNYIYSLTKEYISKKIISIASGVLIVPSFISIFGSIYLMSFIHLYVLCIIIPILAIALYLIISYIRDKRAGYVYLGLSIILMIGFASHDIVLSLLHKTQPFILNYGLLLFVFFQSIFLSKHISGEIVSAELKFEDALHQLIQSEKLSSLGVMVASVAHEINSPLSAVIMTSDSIREHIADFFRELPYYEPIPKDCYPILISLVELSLIQVEPPSGKDYRQQKQELLSHLETLRIDDIEKVSELLVNLGLKEIPKDWISVFSEKRSDSLITLAEKVVMILQGTNTIQIAANRTIKIAQALKNFTHFDPKAEKRSIQLSDSIQNIIAVLEGYTKQGIQIITNFSPIPPILCYPDELNQVWANLLQNAIQSMNGKGSLKIEIGQTNLNGENYAYISIQDSGSGVPQDIIDRIFDPFFTTKPVGQGTGLGLYISKQVIEKHKGIVEVKSKPGDTKFVVYLPYLAKEK
ncbi:histidine kinase [Leptospira congkakensis]|uniref:histidine kinase n=1 Tax=Leptospira congkakensis TaxID=2484932 RepID=A0A4Z1A9N3_9LEPT|nr:ATP-binding protein [Leptospira congkakensis]TGL86058.1 histidine kinase [Leptospira congkakensis]TGL88932.1 histidine kinase [Leptospira congkakensis]TGL93435.1 histidine kinase [Leptospira congkakensis]